MLKPGATRSGRTPAKSTERAKNTDRAKSPHPVPISRWLALAGLPVLLTLTLVYYLQSVPVTQPGSTASPKTVREQHQANQEGHAEPQSRQVQTVSTAPASYLPLILSEQLKWRFDDLILAAEGDDARLQYELEQLADALQLSPADRASMFDLFSRYRDYLMALGQLKQQAPDVGSLLTREDTLAFLRQAHRLQYDFFNDEEIAALFADANRYDEQALARMSSPTAQDAESLRLQLDSLPEADRQILLPSQQALAITEAFTDSAVSSSFSADLSSEQQTRFDQFREDNQHWQQQVNQVIALKQQLAQGQINEQQLTEFLAREFTPSEQKRLDVFLRHPELLSSAAFK
ncbi:lipase secretion chaperone [Shewanella sp. GXUN23E]|uniref:lipase secretion chaperone n=1 Tax=Shewanella sp. GXUN23E TaxID=3422498 RepID=UPI003D7E29E1